MSTSERDGVAREAPALEELLAGRSVLAQPIRVHGKSFFAGDAKHFVRGATYGPFAIGTHSSPFPEQAVVERDFEGVLAICVQHEMDHLEGKLFVDYLSDLKRQRIRKKLEKERKHRAARGGDSVTRSGHTY